MSAPREQQRSAQRERILDAARFLFASRGFDAVAMSEVAERAGVARATVFNHFGSKHALVEAITAGVFDYYAAMLDQALADEAASTPALVRALVRAHGRGIEQFHGFYREVFREIMKIQVGLEEGSAAAHAAERTQERLTRLLARGQQRGELSQRLRRRRSRRARSTASRTARSIAGSTTTPRARCANACARRGDLPRPGRERAEPRRIGARARVRG